MLVCGEPRFVPWTPDFSSSGQASPSWTKLICGGVQLTNAINWVDWLDAEPAVQVELCESCGFTGCETGGYVHVSRLGRHLLWTPPHVDPGDEFKSSWFRASDPVRRYGAVAIRIDDWEAWRRRFDALPDPSEFPRTIRRDLLAAWRGEAPIFTQLDSPDALVSVARQRALAADPSALDDVLAQVESIAKWFAADLDAAVEGELLDVSEIEAEAQTLYLDVPDTFDRSALREWRAITLTADRASPVFGGELVLSPPPD